jgi:hypoxanthine phosphoribosyltransferase
MNEEKIQIHDKSFQLFIENDQIQQAVEQLATLINHQYKDKKLHVLIVLNGAFMFASDLMKKLEMACEISFLRIKSYEGMSSSGKMKQILGLEETLEGKHVLVIEDIVDSGRSINYLNETLLKEKPLTLETVTLFFKPNAFQGRITPQYIGFSISDEFIVGYGMDYLEEGRNLKNIYQYKAN